MQGGAGHPVKKYKVNEGLARERKAYSKDTCGFRVIQEIILMLRTYCGCQALGVYD